jgi:hypothetical protein
MTALPPPPHNLIKCGTYRLQTPFLVSADNVFETGRCQWPGQSSVVWPAAVEARPKLLGTETATAWELVQPEVSVDTGVCGWAGATDWDRPEADKIGELVTAKEHGGPSRLAAMTGPVTLQRVV